MSIIMALFATLNTKKHKAHAHVHMHVQTLHINTYTLAVSTMFWQLSVNVPLGPSDVRAPAVANIDAVSRSLMMLLIESTASLHACVPTAPACIAASIWATYTYSHIDYTCTLYMHTYTSLIQYTCTYTCIYDNIHS